MNRGSMQGATSTFGTPTSQRTSQQHQQQLPIEQHHIDDDEEEEEEPNEEFDQMMDGTGEFGDSADGGVLKEVGVLHA